MSEAGRDAAALGCGVPAAAAAAGVCGLWLVLGGSVWLRFQSDAMDQSLLAVSTVAMQQRCEP